MGTHRKRKCFPLNPDILITHHIGQIFFYTPLPFFIKLFGITYKIVKKQFNTDGVELLSSIIS